MDGKLTNRVLVVDDDPVLIDEYLRCLSSEFTPDIAGSTLTDLEKVLFGEETDERGAVHFEVDSRNQGEAAVSAVERACSDGNPYAIVFIDVRMPPGIDGIEAAKRIRKIDESVNIVVVTGSLSTEPDDLGSIVPPADRIFFFKKPFHAAECRQLAAALCGKWHADLALRRANEQLEQRVIERTEALHRLAYVDPVTDLPNRLGIADALQAMLEDPDQRGKQAAVVLFDLERFSFLNETLGYDSGTELLQAVASRMTESMPLIDGVTGVRVGRFGADEFACIASGAADDTTIQTMAESISDAVEQPFVIDGRDIYLKAAYGVAWSPQHGFDAETVFRCAEAALHRSMRRIDLGITYYHSEMQDRARDRFDMEAELRQAIDAGEISCYYQPQLSLKTGKLAGVEALARWIRPDGSVVPPCDFIPLSEEMGVSDLLFESIFSTVCSSVARWRQELAWDVPVSINLSAHQLRNNKLASQVRSILQQQQLDQHLINLELTETTLLEDLTVAKPLLDELAEFGVGIHIDDFGTGYSSLSYLAELPVQTIKIDKTFTERVTESKVNARVVQAIIALGKAMQLSVVAEGVETEQQLLMVNQFGCDLAQGFFIGHPMPEPDFLDWCSTVDQTSNDLPALDAELVRAAGVERASY